MQLDISYSGYAAGKGSKYCVMQDRDAEPVSKVDRLMSLAPRIEKMGRAVLGDALVSVLALPGPECITLYFRPGAASDAHDQLKFRLRDFLGWVRYCDTKPT